MAFEGTHERWVEPQPEENRERWGKEGGAVREKHQPWRRPESLRVPARLRSKDGGDHTLLPIPFLPGKGPGKAHQDLQKLGCFPSRELP